MALRQSERIEIVTLIDNYTDCLVPSSGNVRRCPHYRNGTVCPPLVAEHGLSLLVRVFDNGIPHSLLFDAGWSESGVLHNLKALEIDVHEIEAIILSHGHMDHYGSLQRILKLKSKPTPVIVHPDVFLQNRFLILPNREKVTFPVLNESSLQKNGAQITKNTVPYSLAKGLVLATGEIKRSVHSEQGIPHAYFDRLGIAERDTILDDQGLIIHLKGKGLVIITGCAHSGIINTIHYAQEITGINSIYALIGGFHLGGVTFEPIIDKTVEVLKAYSPAIICPMHCTGWKATMALARLMPQQFVLSSVGTTLTL